MHQAAIYCIPHTNSVICTPSAQKTTSPHKASEVNHAQANTEITISMLANKSDTQSKHYCANTKSEIPSHIHTLL
jgi:hypothetical protein